MAAACFFRAVAGILSATVLRFGPELIAINIAACIETEDAVRAGWYASDVVSQALSIVN